MDPKSYVLITALPQLDTFFEEGLHRALSGFASMEAETNALGERIFGEHSKASGKIDMPALAEMVRDDGIEFFRDR